VKRFIFLFLLISESCLAQSKAGLTGTHDTSFTIRHEYLKVKKNYEHVKIVDEIHSSSVVEKRNITYCTIGRRKLLVDAFFPSADSRQKRTAVMIIFGGGWRSGNRAMHYPLAERLAALGYVCFTPDYRLSTEALYPAAVNDLKAAVKWIHLNANLFHVDTSKIAVLGFSAGGELAAFLSTTIGDRRFNADNCNSKVSDNINALVDIDGTLSFVHPESGEGDDSKKMSAATLWFGYSKKENSQLWKDASPLSYINPNTPPTLFLNSSLERMHAGREDYIKILDQFHIYTQVKTFPNSPHSFCLFEPWFDSTVHYVDGFLKTVFKKKNFSSTKTVAQDGSGEYNTVQAALNAIPLNNQEPFLIFIKNGVYKEKLVLDSTKNFVTLLGEDQFNTILTYDDHTGKISPKGDTINTYSSQSFLEAANDFTARGITFQNDAGFSAGQAVAIQITGDKARFFNCRFVGNQDVLFPSKASTRQYFDHCYIEGTTDFIFGPSIAWFEGCHIHSKKNSHVTAASTPRENEFGYVFNDCVLTGDSSLHSVSLGRPWRPYANVVYMHCYIGQHIKPEGWSNWNNTENYLTARYAEYKNYGPSSDVLTRVKWTKQLSDDEVKRYVITNVLKDWNPNE